MTQRRRSVVVDARMALDGGIGTYLQQLLPRIATARPDWSITAFGDSARLEALGWAHLDNLRISHTTAPIFSIREQLELTARLGGADLFWAPNYNLPVLTRSRRIVVTIHDVNHLALPELMGGALRRGYARWLISGAVSRAARVLFDSQFTRSEAARLLGTAVDRGTVVYLGVDASWWRAREESPDRPMAEPYFVYVGNIKRHKNVPFLVRAFGRAARQLPHRLVIIGRTDGLRADPDVRREIDAANGRALLLGELSGVDVRRYVAHAEALVTASLYEGFGLPALEAMAAGTPCILADAGSLPEIAADAAVYANPRSESSFADAMVMVARDGAMREALVARGRARAAAFSWDRCAAETMRVLADTLTPTA